jgi:hypothetical protein
MKRININLALDEISLDYCLGINAGIHTITDSQIVFSENSTMIPHITLVMGNLTGSYTVQDIAEEIKQAVKVPLVLNTVITSPYLEKNTNSFIFSDVIVDRDFIAFRQDLKKRMQNYLSNIFNPPSSVPHISLGYITNKKREVQSYLEGIQINHKLLSPAIRISNVGVKGTCINVLFQIDMVGNEHEIH